MSKDEYRILIQKYMDEFNIPIWYICLKQINSSNMTLGWKKYYDIKYEQAFVDTCNNNIENGYNIPVVIPCYQRHYMYQE